MKITAFIPARGGSKGIPRKNMVLLNGKPLIQYTIESAQKSKFITDIFISSEDKEIIDFCKLLGIPVTYIRPFELATDEASMIDTVLHGIKWMQENTELPHIIVLLQPTSPLRTTSDIDEAIELFINAQAHSLISVHKMIEHPYECLKAKNNNEWEYLARPENEAVRRQDYKDDFYYINGAIYIARVDFLKENRTFIKENKTLLYIMPQDRGVDIDDIYGLKQAEFFLKYK